MKFHRDGSQPEKDQVFVFGSNTAGRHGKGAAKQALRYGAKYGRGIGISGMTYAIPTKDSDLLVLPLEVIAAYIDRFRRFSRSNPNISFFITSVGTGLAGYRDKDIAPLFRGCGDNCSFPSNWQSFLESSS